MILDKQYIKIYHLIRSLKSLSRSHILSLSTVLTLSNYMHKGHLLATASKCPLCFLDFRYLNTFYTASFRILGIYLVEDIRL